MNSRTVANRGCGSIVVVHMAGWNKRQPAINNIISAAIILHAAWRSANIYISKQNAMDIYT